MGCWIGRGSRWVGGGRCWGGSPRRRRTATRSDKRRLTADSSIGRICGCGHARTHPARPSRRTRRDAEATRMTLPDQVEPMDRALDAPVPQVSALRLTLTSPLYRGATLPVVLSPFGISAAAPQI